ncbi:MAG: phosphatidate cytidylyltransferase [Elusimicrobiota bacterium]
MNRKRIIWSLILIPVVYVFILWGGFAFFIFISGLLIGGILEFYKMCEDNKIPVVKWWGIVITMGLLINTYVITRGEMPSFSTDLASPLISLSVMGILVILLFKRDLKSSILSGGATIFGIFYISWLGIHAILLREIKPFGFEFTLSAVIATWVSDTGAFYVGKGLGKKKLHIASPKKSRAGAVGSIIFGMIAMIILKYIFNLYFIELYYMAVLGALVGAMAVIGDLSESIIKRNLGKKDSGKFLPGHGGILDRIDSIIFTVPIVYYFFKLIR